MPLTYADYWWEPVQDPALRQGDLFRDLLVFWFPDDLTTYDRDPPADAKIPTKFDRGEWIIFSASCDIDRTSQVGVVLGRVLTATTSTLRAQNQKEFNSKVEVLRKGFDPARFLLADCPIASPPLDLSFVQFRTQVSLPANYLRGQPTRTRLRLKSPHREHFGSWVGASFARVGIEDYMQIPPRPKTSTYASDVLRAADDP